MRCIKYPAIEKQNEWLEAIAKEVSCKIINNTVMLPEELGKGHFKQFLPCEWLTMSYFKVFVKKPITLHRIGHHNRPFIPIVFFLNDTAQTIGNKHFQVGLHNPNGIFMPSPSVDSKWQVPAGKWITNLTLAFNRQWVINELDNKNSYVYQLLNDEKPFYIFESLSPSLLHSINNIKSYIATNTELNKFKIYSLSIHLFALFMEQLNNRESGLSRIKINPADVKKLFEIRKLILEDPCKIPSIQQLSDQAIMSTSKLQKGFKQVFGKSITQYALTEKMQLAKTMLESKQHKANEVAYQLGYTNLSHFGKAFKNAFGITPGLYLDILK